jgi:hypothetical protein
LKETSAFFACFPFALGSLCLRFASLGKQDKKNADNLLRNPHIMQKHLMEV